MEILHASTAGDQLTINILIDRIDMAVARTVREALNNSLQANPKKVFLDLEKVTNIDSTGMGILKVFLETVAERGGQLTLGHVQKQVMMVLKLSQLDNFFKYFPEPEPFDD